MGEYDEFPFRKKKEDDDILPEKWFDVLWLYMEEIRDLRSALQKRGPWYDEPSLDRIKSEAAWSDLTTVGEHLLDGLRRYPKGEWPATLSLLAEFRPEASALILMSCQDNTHAEELAGLNRCLALAERLNLRVPK